MCRHVYRLIEVKCHQSFAIGMLINIMVSSCVRLIEVWLYMLVDDGKSFSTLWNTSSWEFADVYFIPMHVRHFILRREEWLKFIMIYCVCRLIHMIRQDTLFHPKYGTSQPLMMENSYVTFGTSSFQQTMRDKIYSKLKEKLDANHWHSTIKNL